MVGMGTVTLKADDSIQLEAAANTASQHSSNKSSSASIGISLGANTGITFSASGAKGASSGSETSWTNSHIHAGEKLTLDSSGNTTLKGATASGKQVVASIAGDLTIESLQDIATYDSQQKNWGFSLTVGPSPGASISSGKSKAAGDYASVTEQSGLFAGDEGFDVRVQGHTTLNGGVIASSQTAIEQNKNSFETGTLAIQDLENHSVAEAKSSGFTLSTDMFSQGKYGVIKGVLGNSLDNASVAEASNGDTRSAIAAGNVIVTDSAGQLRLTGQSSEQTVTTLNRDVDSSHQAAKYQNAQAVLEQAEAHRVITQAVYKEAVKFSDEAYRVAMVEKAEMRKVLRGKDGEVLLAADGKPLSVPLTAEEKRNLKPGADGKVHIFANGIFNDTTAAVGYAAQMTKAGDGEIYLVHFPQANNVLSELLVAGYQKFMEGDAWGLTNSSQEFVNLMNEYGNDGLALYGHSRGAMTIINAMEVLANEPAGNVVLGNTSVSLFGPAYNAQEAAGLLNRLSGGRNSVVQLENHAADFVGSLIGANPPTWDQIPPGSSKAQEWIRMLGDAPTVHSCYGNGGMNSMGCKNAYGPSVSFPIPGRQSPINWSQQ